MPPTDTQDEEINRLFDSSRTPGQHDTGPHVSNANLTPEALGSVFAAAYEQAVKVVALTTSMTSNSCQVIYLVNKANNPSPNEEAYVEITYYSTPDAADAAMKKHLHGFEGSISEAATSARIGSRSLQMLCSVFFVRDTVFAKIRSESISGKPAHFLTTSHV